MGDLNLDLCYMTATQAIAAFKSHSLSPVELLKRSSRDASSFSRKSTRLSGTDFVRARLPLLCMHVRSRASRAISVTSEESPETGTGWPRKGDLNLRDP